MLRAMSRLSQISQDYPYRPRNLATALRMSIDIAMRHCEVTCWWCKDFRWLKIHLRLALACEGGERHENGAEEPQGLAMRPTPWRPMAGTRVRAHAFAFDGRGPVRLSALALGSFDIALV